MGIFDKIKGAIWGSDEPEKPAAPKPQVSPAPTQTASAGSAMPTPTASPAPTPSAQPAPQPTSSTPAGAGQPASGTSPSSAQPSAAPASPPSAPMGSSGSASGQGSVDVAAIMDAAVKKKGQKLDWRHSIVDMMKALDLDSDLAARKELAEELHYTGDTHDSAKMNVWLHKALMQKLAENGGKVPAELTD